MAVDERETAAHMCQNTLTDPMTSLIALAALGANSWESAKFIGLDANSSADLPPPAEALEETQCAAVDASDAPIVCNDEKRQPTRESLLSFWIAFATLHLGGSALAWVPFSGSLRLALLISLLVPGKQVRWKPTRQKTHYDRTALSLTLHNIPSSPQIPNWLHSAILAPALDAIDRRLASHLGALRLVVARCASLAIRSVLLPLLRSAVRRVPDADVLCLAESVSALGREFQAENTRRLQASVAPLMLQQSPPSSNGGADKTNMAAAIDAKSAVPRAHEQLAIKQRPTNQISETIVRRNVAPKRSDASKRQSIM